MLLMSLNPPSVYPCAIHCRRGFIRFAQLNARPGSGSLPAGWTTPTSQKDTRAAAQLKYGTLSDLERQLKAEEARLVEVAEARQDAGQGGHRGRRGRGT